MPGTRRTDPFYLSAEWRRARARVLSAQPTCLECGEAKSAHVDHVQPRRLFPELSLDEANLRALCDACHNRRSARQWAAAAGGVGENGEPLDPTHPWHAGEGARVSFKGGKRAPEEWQLPILRGAVMASGSMGREAPSLAPPEEVGLSGLLAGLPPVRP